MSYFKSKAIILKKIKYGEKESIYSIFSYDFWRIDVIKKKSSKEKPIDVWYDISFELHSSTNLKISRISNIKILQEFNPSGKDFDSIHDYLSLLSHILKKTEKNAPIYEIYVLLHALLKTNISTEKILLSKLKLWQILWELRTDSSDETLSKVLGYIGTHSSKDCLRLTGLSSEHCKKLEDLMSD